MITALTTTTTTAFIRIPFTTNPMTKTRRLTTYYQRPPQPPITITNLDYNDNNQTAAGIYERIRTFGLRPPPTTNTTTTNATTTTTESPPYYPPLPPLHTLDPKEVFTLPWLDLIPLNTTTAKPSLISRFIANIYLKLALLRIPRDLLESNVTLRREKEDRLVEFMSWELERASLDPKKRPLQAAVYRAPLGYLNQTAPSWLQRPHRGNFTTTTTTTTTSTTTTTTSTSTTSSSKVAAGSSTNSSADGGGNATTTAAAVVVTTPTTTTTTTTTTTGTPMFTYRPPGKRARVRAAIWRFIIPTFFGFWKTIPKKSILVASIRGTDLNIES